MSSKRSYNLERAERILNNAYKRTTRVYQAGARLSEDAEHINLLNSNLTNEEFDFTGETFSDLHLSPYSVPDFDFPPIRTLPYVDVEPFIEAGSELAIAGEVVEGGLLALAVPELLVVGAAAGTLYGAYKVGQALGRQYRSKEAGAPVPQNTTTVIDPKKR